MQSISAFAPIANPTLSDWGKKAFAGYLGHNPNEWEMYDATVIIQNYNGLFRSILIDQVVNLFILGNRRYLFKSITTNEFIKGS